jgi:hypothetical protein
MTASSELIQHQIAPPDHILQMFGGINLMWARLDALCSAYLFTLVQLEPIEFIIVVGKLDLLAKLQRIKKLFLHRKQEENSKKIGAIISILDGLKDERNAITHGFYIGMSKEDQIFITIFTDLVTHSSTETGTRLFISTPKSLSEHGTAIAQSVDDMMKIFDRGRMQELLGMPGYSPKPPS